MRGELIGKGTYSRVYLALDTTTGEMVAVKEVEVPMSKDDRDIQHQTSLPRRSKQKAVFYKSLIILILFNIWASKRLLMS